MDSKELRNLHEAYMDVYAPQEIDEAVKGESGERRKDLAAERRSGIKPLSAKEGQKYASHKLSQMSYVKRQRMGEEVEGLDEISKELSGRVVNARIARTGRAFDREMKDRTPENMRDTVNAVDKETRAKRLAAGVRTRRNATNEEFDIFDTVLEFLQVEGYAETLEEAEWLMANVIDEEAIDIILGEEQLDEGAAGDVAARAEKLAAQRKGQTPERKQMYASLAYKASERERGPRNTDWQRQGLTQKQRNSRREIDVEYSDETGLKNSTDGPGTITKNKRKLAQQKARGQHAEQYMDEAQVANRDPDRYEAGQQKKSAPVRGEKTPMPPRGDKRREDFEKWYAANVR